MLTQALGEVKKKGEEGRRGIDSSTAMTWFLNLTSFGPNQASVLNIFMTVEKFRILSWREKLYVALALSLPSLATYIPTYHTLHPNSIVHD